MREDHRIEDDPIPELSDDLTVFAARLSSFEAKSVAVNRDQMMFAAGQAAAQSDRQLLVNASRRTLRFWQSAAALMASVSLGLGTTMALSSSPEPRVVIVESDQPASVIDSRATATGKDDTQLAEKKASEPIRESQNVTNSTIVGTDSTRLSNQFKEPLVRRGLVDRFLNDLSSADRLLAQPIIRVEVSPGELGDPISTPRSLMMGERSQILIKNLLEEQKL